MESERKNSLCFSALGDACRLVPLAPSVTAENPGVCFRSEASAVSVLRSPRLARGGRPTPETAVQPHAVLASTSLLPSPRTAGPAACTGRALWERATFGALRTGEFGHQAEWDAGDRTGHLPGPPSTRAQQTKPACSRPWGTRPEGRSVWTQERVGGSGERGRAGAGADQPRSSHA